MHPFRSALRGLAGLALTALVALPVTAAISSASGEDTPPGSVTDALARGVAVPAADAPSRCHGAGALIRHHGRVERVSLARGLRTYEHRAPGTFLRLCPDTAAADTSGPVARNLSDASASGGTVTP